MKHAPSSLHIIPFHSTTSTRDDFVAFLDVIANSLHHTLHLGVVLVHRQISYIVSADEESLEYISNEIYTRFPGYEIMPVVSPIFSPSLPTLKHRITLANKGFYPFLMHKEEESMSGIFRLFDQVNPEDTVYLDFALRPRHTSERGFFIGAHIKFALVRMKKILQFYKYLWNPKIEKDWKHKSHEYFEHKMHHEVFEVGITLFEQSATKRYSFSKLLGKYFDRYKHFPYNHFVFSSNTIPPGGVFQDLLSHSYPSIILTPEEVGALLHFPTDPKTEPKLLRINSKRLPAPNDVPIPMLGDTQNITPLGISNYR